MRSVTFNVLDPVQTKKHASAKAPAIQFGTEPPLPRQNAAPNAQSSATWFSRFRKTLMFPVALSALLFPAFSLRANAQGNNDARVWTDANGVERMSRTYDIDENTTPVVKGPQSLPEIRPEIKQIIYDLKNNPWLTREDREYIEQKLLNLYQQGIFQGKVIILPSIASETIKETVNPITNENLKPGKELDNWGAVLGVVADRAKTMAKEKIMIAPTDNLKAGLGESTFAKQSSKLLIDHANTHFQKAKDARERGDFKTEAREKSKGVREAIDTFSEWVEKSKPVPQAPPKVETPAERDIRVRREAEERAAWQATATQVGFYLFVGLLSLTAIGGAGLAIHNKRQRELEEQRRLEVIKSALMDSDYAVTKENAYSAETLGHVLSATASEKVSTKDILTAVGAIYTSDKRTDGLDKYKYELISKGLVHPSAEIRQRVVQEMIDDGLNREDFEPFITLLKAEKSKTVVDTLVPALKKIAVAEDIPAFNEQLQTSDQPAVRYLSIEVMTKFPTAGTVEQFITALGKENVDGLIRDLQQGVADLAKKEDAPLLIAGMAKDKPTRIQLASLQALAKVGDESHFDALYQRFTENDNTALQAAFVSALETTVTKAKVPQLTQALQGKSHLQQKVAINLLSKVKGSEVLEPLFAYLERPDTQYPQEATDVLVSALKKKDIPMLLAKIESDDPKTDDKDVILAAIQGVRKFEKDVDLAMLGKLSIALEKQKSPNVIAALTEAMDDSKETPESFEFFADLLKNSKKEHVRIAAVLSLDDFGEKALEPLLDALPAATSNKEVDAMNSAIFKIGKNEKFLPVFESRTNSREPRIQTIATNMVVSFIEDWRESKSYDDSATMAQLQGFGKSKSQAVKSAADTTYNRLVDRKVNDIEKVGRSGNFESGSKDRKTLKALRDSASEKAINRAAEYALSKLDSRKREWEAEQARLAEQRRLAAIAAAEAAARAAAAAAEAAAAAARRRSYSSCSSSSSSSSSWSSCSSSSSSCSSSSCSSSSCGSASSCGGSA